MHPTPSRIYLSSPHLGDDEFKLVQDAFASNWIAPLGPHVDAFEKDGMVTVEVADNGVGMTEEELNKLFHLDTHFTSSGTNNEKGTGLGLILIKDFVLMNGGKYKIKSSVGKGTSFSFTLPLAKE